MKKIPYNLKWKIQERRYTGSDELIMFFVQFLKILNTVRR